MEQFEAAEVGKRIAQARLELGLTQEQLAEIASFSKRSLQDYEGGVTIPYKHLREIGRLLKRPVHWFLHGDDEAATALDPKVVERLGAAVVSLAEEAARLEAIADRLESQAKPPAASSS